MNRPYCQMIRTKSEGLGGDVDRQTCMPPAESAHCVFDRAVVIDPELTRLIVHAILCGL